MRVTHTNVMGGSLIFGAVSIVFFRFTSAPMRDEMTKRKLVKDEVGTSNPRLTNKEA